MITNNWIAGKPSAHGIDTISSINPATKKQLPENFSVATKEEIAAAAAAANAAWKIYKKTSAQVKAQFLRSIADEIEKLGDRLIDRAMAESGLPKGRIQGERGRTCNQLRLFADLVSEGSWVEAIIDEALPHRTPMPRADLRKMSVALGPVAVFAASNFPLAFSTAGGDTASALAAGCPVIVKAHPSHLGTNALITEAIAKAIEHCQLPQGIFSTIQGGHVAGQLLVKHPLIKAVGFTGSFRGGQALLNIANSRPHPIPVYAEMGSSNPIFILPEKLNKAYQELAKSIAASVNLGAGQFCTNPGLLIMEKSNQSTAFTLALKSEFAALSPATMLNEDIFKAYNVGKSNCLNATGITFQFDQVSSTEEWKGQPAFGEISAAQFLAQEYLQEEIFGPFTLLIRCESKSEMLKIAESLRGQLTATLHGTEQELSQADELFDILSEKAGRVLFNGVPTGVEVCAAMHHGGPFPATNNAQFTSVGTDAIKRFVRPVCYQNAPESLLPPALQSSNPLQIWRKVNGEKIKG